MEDDFYFLFDPVDISTPMSEAVWWFMLDNRRKWQHLEDSRANGVTQAQINLLYRTYNEKEAVVDKKN